MLVELARERASLEDIFVRLTTGDELDGGEVPATAADASGEESEPAAADEPPAGEGEVSP